MRSEAVAKGRILHIAGNGEDGTGENCEAITLAILRILCYIIGVKKILTIEKFGAFGEGVAHSDGKVVFVKGALPGEVVLARPVVEKKSFVSASLEKVISPSKDRINPPCPYFFRCGGCALEHMDYSAQLSLKAQTVVETLWKVGGISVSIDKVTASPNIYRYRNKLSFPVRGAKVGLYTENSHDVVDISDCLLQKEWNRELIAALRRFMADYGFFRNDERHGIRHIVAREKCGSICIVLVTANDVDVKGFCDYITFPDFALYQNVNTSENNVILGDRYCFLGGRGKFPDFHPASFYQVNDEIEAALYADVAARCEGEVVIDAYCGAGNLTLELARRAKAVYGIEICRQAVDEAVKRANERRVHNVSFICGDCKVKLPELIQNSNMGVEKGGITVVFDPPRKGVDQDSLDAVKELSPEKIVYVSCNPATLARDLRILGSTYTLTSLNIYDMFPQTPHVETLAVLHRN